jgi:hypothetical protein
MPIRTIRVQSRPLLLRQPFPLPPNPGQVWGGDWALPTITVSGSLQSWVGAWELPTVESSGATGWSVDIPVYPVDVAGTILSGQAYVGALELSAAALSGSLLAPFRGALELPVVGVSGGLYEEILWGGNIALPVVLSLRGTLSLYGVGGVAGTGAVAVSPDDYETWCLNVKTKGHSLYSQITINGLATLGGRLVIATGDGLFTLDGDTDDGLPIEATITSKVDNFGALEKKRVPDVSVYGRASGLLSVGLVVEEVRSSEYQISMRNSKPGLHVKRVAIGRGLMGNNIQTTITNPGGGAFDLKEVRLLIETVSRR